ncbi:MAG: PIN domain-containing protein [Fimbriimonas sp.]|nr:PIN domain-containing protein [Fimbriimonas sp.]
MKAFLDTSVLVATFYGDHVHHNASLDLFLRFGKSETSCGAHSLAEVYGTLTGMPPPRRVGATEALLFLDDVQANLSIVTLSDSEYGDAIRSAASQQVFGGGIYDALLAQCALRVNAEAIYTLNAKHFLRLSPHIASMVRSP